VPGEQAELPARTDVLLRLGRVGGWVAAVDRQRRKVIAMRPGTDRNSS
jgi:prephenate dehydrogenase